jgi:hypothetical protein
MALLTGGLGFAGFASYFAGLGQERSALDMLYLSLQLFTLESGAVPGPVPTGLEIARLLAPAVVGYTAVKAVVAIFRSEIQRSKVRFFRRHVIVCGLGEQGASLVRSFLRAGYRVVAIDVDALSREIQPSESHGAIALVGDTTDAESMIRAGVRRASYLFAV